MPEFKQYFQVLLEIIRYYRCFIQNFVKIADPLFYLLKGESKFIWTEESETAFYELCNSLKKAPVLAYLDFNKPFIV